MINYAEMPRKDRIDIRDQWAKEKRDRIRKDQAKKGLSKILEVKKKDLPTSKAILDKMVNVKGIGGEKKNKIDVLKKFAY